MLSSTIPNIENHISNPRGWLWIVSAITHGFGFLVFGAYYENGSNTYMKISTSGALFGTPAEIPPPVAANVLLSDLFAGLYNIYPAVPWYDLFSLTFSIISLTLLLFFLIEFAESVKKRWTLVLLGVALYAPNIVLFEFTRISMVMAFSSIALLLVKSQLKFQLITLSILGLISMLIRPDSFAIALAYALPVAFLTKKLIHAKRLIPLLFLYSGVLYLLNIPLNQDSKNYLHLRPYQITLFDFDVEFKEQFRSEKDSTIIAAVRNGFLNDPSTITKETLAIYIPSLDKTPFQLVEYLKRNPISTESLSFLFNTLNPYNTYTPWLGLFVFMMGLFITMPKNKRVSSATVYGLGGLVSFIVVGIYFKTVAHVLYPSFICIVAGLVVIARIKRLPANPIIIYSIALSVANYFTIEKHFEKTEISQASSIKAINKYVSSRPSKFEDQVFVYGLKSLVRTNSSLFNSKDYILPNSFSFDNGFLYHSEAYRVSAKNIFNTIETKEILMFILDNPNQFIFLATPLRIEFLREYFNRIHEVNFTYSIEYQPESNLSADRNPSLVKLRKLDA